MSLNIHGIRAIYRFEIARTLRTITQSVIAPVLTTSLYFIVFGTAIGSRMGDIDNVSYGAFIIPGLVMLSLLNESISNASFGIYMPKWSGTIYELLSAPVSWFEVLLGYVGAAATKSMLLGLLILGTARLFVPYHIEHPLWMVVTPLTFLGGAFYSISMLPPVWQTLSLFNPVVYLISGFRWSFYGQADVHIAVSTGMTLGFMLVCLAVIWWIFRTGYRLRR